LRHKCLLRMDFLHGPTPLTKYVAT
jgi:hypothetical protein